MSTYVCVPKAELSDDILEGLINPATPKTIITPLHTSFANRFQKINKQKKECLENISSLFSGGDYLALRDALNNSDSIFLSELNSPYENIEPEESQIDYVKEHYPNVEIVSSTFNSVSFKYNDNIALSYRDTKKSEFWKFEFSPQINVSLIFTDKSITINRVIISTGHPYASLDNVVKNINKINLSNKYYLAQIITMITNHLTTYTAANFIRPISDFIGHKCSITGLYTYSDGVKCAKTGAWMLKSAAKEINGRYYSPAIIKKCSKCEVESPSWISKNKEIICGECYDN